MQHQAKSIDLDMFRWVAAFAVVVGHCRGLFLGYADQIPSGSPLVTLLFKGFYFITGFPAEAVMVFFVLSGYLVGGGSLQRLRAGRFDVYGYATDRFSRIYIVLVPALLLGLLLDGVGLLAFNGSGLYSGGSSWLPVTEADFSERFTVAAFMASAFQLQGIAAPVFGSNSPLWSLGYECWYYALWGIGCWGLSRCGAARVLALVAVAVLLAILPLKLSLYGSLWLLGVLAAAAPMPRVRVRLIAAVLVVAALVTSRVIGRHDASLWQVFGLDALIGATFAFLLWARRIRSLTTLSAHERLAGFSFSLYVTHYPLAMFLAAMLNQTAGLHFSQGITAGTVAAFVGALAICVLAAWMFSRVTEENTGWFRELLRRLSRRAVKAA